MVIIILLLVKGCGKNEGNRYDDLVKAAKKYYEEEKSELPELYGEQATVTLKDLKDGKFLENPKAFNECAEASTYVKVSKLESGKYHYTPVLNCTNEETAFGSCIVGTEKDLEEDSSNVEFSFIASKLEKGKKEYYPTKTNDVTKVKEYYKTAPSAEYNLTDDKGQTGYKYYKVVPAGKAYWNNGAYSETAPAGYPNKGTSKQVTLTRYRVVAKWRFVCKDSNVTGLILSDVECSKRKDENGNPAKTHLEIDFSSGTQGMVTTCNGKDLAQAGTECQGWSDWTTATCKEDNFTGVRCESKAVTQYQWYKNTTESRQYYPSKKATAAEESTYYLEAPAEGYIKDETSVATVYRYYKFIKLAADDKNATVEEWVKINEKASSKEEMIKALQELKYEVETLEDINNEENLKYEVVLKYCNRK